MLASNTDGTEFTLLLTTPIPGFWAYNSLHTSAFEETHSWMLNIPNFLVLICEHKYLISSTGKEAELGFRFKSQKCKDL